MSAAAGPDALTVLRTTTAGRIATKRFRVGRGGRVSKAGYGNEEWFSAQTVVAGSWAALAPVLEGLQDEPRACVVRGRLLPHADPARTRRRLLDAPDGPHTLEPAPRRWLLIDLDRVSNRWALDPRLPDEADELIEHLIGLLPAEFHHVTCWAQWSSSQCVPERVARPGEPPPDRYAPPELLSIHLWFRLDRPIPDADLARWAKWLRKTTGLNIDPKLFHPIQPHYVARPIFDGLRDPLPRRSGLREGEVDEVALALPEPDPERSSNGRAADAEGFFEGGAGFEHYLGRIGDDGDGFQEPIMRAVASYFATHGPDAAPEPLKARLIEAIAAAAPGNRSAVDIERYASDAFLDGKISWARDREALKPRPPVGPAPPPPEGSPEAAELALSAALDRGLTTLTSPATDPDAPPPAFGIAAPAGLGKTRETLVRDELRNRHVVYAVPEHRLSEELLARLDPNGPAGRIIRGRSQKLPDGTPLCAKAELAERVARLGASVTETLCRRQRDDGTVETCEHYAGCPYIAQFQDTDPAVRFMPHSYLFLPRQPGLPKPDLVVIDERFWTSAERGMNARTFVPLARLERGPHIPNRSKRQSFFGSIHLGRTSDMALITGRAHRALKAAADAGRQPSPADLHAAGLTAADCRFAMGEWYQLVERLDVTPGMPTAEQRKRLAQAKATEAHRMARLWRILAEEIDLKGRDRLYGLELREVVNGDHLPEWRIVMRWSADLAEWVRGAPVLLLDADLDPLLARRFLPQIEVTAITCARRAAHVTQITDRPVAKRMLAYAGADPDEAQRAANRRNDLRALLEVKAFPLQDGDLLAVTYKAAVEALLALGDVPGVDWANFNAIRGKDRWKDVLTLVLAGRPQPSVEELERLTRALFHKSGQTITPIPPDATGRRLYAKELRPIQLANGRQRLVPVDVHPDPLCMVVLRQIRECELLQVIDRLRLIWRPPSLPCRILLLCNLPLPLPVHRLTTWNEIMPNRFVRAFVRGGVLPLSRRELARCFPDLWASPRRVEEDYATRAANARSGPVSLLIMIYRESGPLRLLRVSYRRPNQRGSPSPAVIAADLPNPRAALEAVVGPIEGFTVLPDDEAAGS